MSKHPGTLEGQQLAALTAFPEKARTTFSAAYPEIAHKLPHQLNNNPLYDLDALAQLGESLPASSIEYNRGNLPVGIDHKPDGNGLTIGETIRNIAHADSWAVLKNIEQNEDYGAHLSCLLGELRDNIERKTGRMLKPQGFIFISSPNAVTPYHFDPEHNILLQLRGSKVMTVFPAADARLAPDEFHEQYHTGGARELQWKDEFKAIGQPFTLQPAQAIYVPVMAPHFVKNGPDVSISLSITWRSEWSFAEADARAFNGLLRQAGVDPAPTQRWPARNIGKATAWRIARRFPGIH